MRLFFALLIGFSALVHASSTDIDLSPCGTAIFYARISGGDTLIVERVDRDSIGTSGLLISKRGVTRYHVASLKMRVGVVAEVAAWRVIGDTALSPLQKGVLSVSGRTATFVASAGERRQTQTDSIRSDASILFNAASGLENELLFRSRGTSEQADSFPTFYVASGGYSPTAFVTWVARDSVVIRLGTTKIRGRLDDLGRLLSSEYQDADSRDVILVKQIDCSDFMRLSQRIGGSDSPQQVVGELGSATSSRSRNSPKGRGYKRALNLPMSNRDRSH